MKLNPDYRDMLSGFSEAKAEYLLIRAYALASHGLVRATKNIDLWVRPTPENAARVVKALISFGAPVDHFSAEDFTRPNNVLQVGVAPVRIDLTTSVSGLTFEKAWKSREVIEVDDLSVPVIGLAGLITNKRSSGRPQDLVDLEWLENVDD
ncbi:MAG TPA: hypothetical protein VLV83_26305 [Acidobacteriota bacterium]|nr:hypothetical protein [Acidobacteriota bacterium]